MAGLVLMEPATSAFWVGRKVFVTGHMGFKGAWLCATLDTLGARVTGYGRDERDNLLFRQLRSSSFVGHQGDIGDVHLLASALAGSEAEIVFHLAAQPLVRASYRDPLGTVQSNVLGTVSLLEAVRAAEAVRAVVVVTSDKVYQPRTDIAHVEGDALGGNDIYSASKAAAELLTVAMTKSFLNGQRRVAVATARAGNVIGGGDWAEDRLLPDAGRAFVNGAPMRIRNPDAVRPWQHVLEPLHGYLALAQVLIEDTGNRLSSINFGPSPQDVLKVSEVLELFCAAWPDHPGWQVERDAEELAETPHLRIDSTLATERLGWRPVWTAAQAIERTARFYARAAAGQDCGKLLAADLADYQLDQAWSKS